MEKVVSFRWIFWLSWPEWACKFMMISDLIQVLEIVRTYFCQVVLDPHSCKVNFLAMPVYLCMTSSQCLTTKKNIGL